MQVINYLVDRLKEPSTWRGIVLVLTSSGILTIPATTTEIIIAAGVGLAGLIGIFTKDK